MDISTVLTTLLLLFIVRFTALIVCFPANFESLWRSGNQSEFSIIASSIILFIVGSYAISLFYKQIKGTNNKIKISFFVYLGIIYSFLIFFSRDIYNSFSYQYFIQAFNINISELLPYLELDFFYEKPYAFWGFLFMAIMFIIFYKKAKIEIAILLWIIPFSFINYMKLSDITLVYMLSLLITSILGFKYSQQKNSSKNFNPKLIYSFQFLITLAIVTYISTIPGKTYSLKYFLQLLAIFYIPGIALMTICLKSNCLSAKNSTWIIPFTTGFALCLPMLRLPTSYCFVNCLGFINTYIFTGNTAIIVGIVFLISYLFKIISKSLSKIVYIFLSLIAIVYYILDFVLFSYSQFRLNYHTLKWTSTMNDIWTTTMKTCMAYVSTSSLISIAVFTTLLVFIAIKGKKIFKKYNNFSFSFLIIIISAHVSFVLMQMSDAMPFILRDSFTELLKSLPNPIVTEKILSMAELKKELKNCGINLKEYEEKEASDNPKNNLILVTLESVHWKYFDMFSNELRTCPNLSKYQNRMEIFPFFFSNYPESSSADFTVVSGLQSPSHIYIENKNLFNYSTIAKELKKNGYMNYMFCSGSIVDGNRISIVKSMPFDYLFYFETGKIKPGLESWNWGYKDHAMINEMISKLSEREKSKPYFLWYRMVCPHAPFDVLEGKYDYLFKADDKNQVKTLIDYKNSLLYIDREISRFISSIDELNKQNKENTIIALVADHGEMLGEEDNFGLKGHGPYAKADLTAVPFIIVSQEPHGLKINKNYGSQIDVFPTLLDKLEIKPSTKHFGFGESLISDIASRPIYLSSIHSMALIENSYYFDFRDKRSSNVIISKISLASDSRPMFIPVTNWSYQDIQEKYNRTKKFFELNKHLMENY